MLSEYTKFKLNQRVRRVKKRGLEQSDIVQAGARKQIVNRWRRLKAVRGFVLSWWAIWLVLICGLVWQWGVLGGSYQNLIPAAGGTYSEGIIGPITTINPLFSVDDNDAAASRLVFNGLLRYDETGSLTTDLAKSWVTNDSGRTYTVVLRDDVRWHDGEKLTVDDVIYTFQAIQHPDTRSPLNASWRDITITTKDDHTIEFVLPNAFAPFPHSLTTGIVPEHILGPLGFNGLRGSSFNQEPIGTGPFKFLKLDIERGETSFVANKDYFRTKPQLERIILRSYENSDELLQAYKEGIVTAVADLQLENLSELESMKRSYEKRSVPTASAVFAFYKTSQSELSDKSVRRALAQAINPVLVLQSLELKDRALSLPILPNQIGYKRTFAQLEFSKEKAATALDQAGWSVGSDGIRVKGNRKLVLNLFTQQSSDYSAVANVIAEAWRQIGVQVNIMVLPAEQLLQDHVKTHDYDVLIYAIDLGADPDVFAYWHSSQAAPPGLNLSEYQNAVVDEALAAGRTRTDTRLRAAKYQTFLQKWRDDAPATALYERRFVYIQHSDARTFEATRFVHSADRFNNVEEWTVRLERE